MHEKGACKRVHGLTRDPLRRLGCLKAASRMAHRQVLGRALQSMRSMLGAQSVKCPTHEVALGRAGSAEAKCGNRHGDCQGDLRWNAARQTKLTRSALLTARLAVNKCVRDPRMRAHGGRLQSHALGEG